MTAQQQPKRNEIDFPPNVPITVTMKYAQPRSVSGKYGERFMFTTADDQRFFLDPEVAEQIAELGINTNEPFIICKHASGKQSAPVTWEVSRPVSPHGPLSIPRDQQSEAQPAPKPPGRAGSTLAEDAKAAVDAFAEVLQYGLTQHGGKVKPEEIQRIFTTVYIQRKGAA